LSNPHILFFSIKFFLIINKNMSEVTMILNLPPGDRYYKKCYPSGTDHRDCNHPEDKFCTWVGCKNSPGFHKNQCRTYKDYCNTIGVSEMGEEPASQPMKWLNAEGACDQAQCTYDTRKLDSLDQINKWSQAYGTDNDGYKTLVSHYCAKDTNSMCPNNIAGQAMNRCSRMLSRDPNYDICRALNNTYNQYTDNIKVDYCSMFPSGSDCYCINRQSNEDYKTVKQYYPINDKCWWLPCGSLTNTLIDSGIHNSDQCPDNICQQVLEIKDPQAEAIIEGNTLVLNCSSGGGGSGGGGGGGSENKNNSAWIYVLTTIVVIIFLVMIIGIITYYFVNRKKKGINKRK
jgi:preprotein translocase subunit SecG